MSLEIDRIRIENIRGFTNTSLSMRSKNTIIVGPNNSGKTSVLLLLEWIFNEWPKEILWDKAILTDRILGQLTPARNTKRKARRITLDIKIKDRRSHKYFKCEKGIASLRINLRMTPQPSIYLALGKPKRGEKAETTPKARDLLERVYEKIHFILIPSFRDGKSQRFEKTMIAVFKNKLENAVLHEEMGGKPKGYREFNKAFNKLKKLSEESAQPIWEEVLKLLPEGIASDGRIFSDIDKNDLIELCAQKLHLKISTGKHDSSMVPIVDLGAGLQSLLDLVIHLGESVSEGKHIILAIEEPEAFLHPAAQRAIAKLLYELNEKYQILVTTHSPTIVEEAKYGDVVVCRDQRYFEPALLENRQRNEINTALLSGYGAEMMFATSVLLVEGEGDRQFFERIRRRIAKVDLKGRTEKLFVVPVGGKRSFAPWIRLLQSYKKGEFMPINWLVVVDSDATGDIQTAYRNAGIPLVKAISNDLNALGAKMKRIDTENKEALISRINGINERSNNLKNNFVLLPIDLEYVMLSCAKKPTIDMLSKKLDTPMSTVEDGMVKIGSKLKGSGSRDEYKAPWIRGFIGENIPYDELSPIIDFIISKWMEPLVTKQEVATIIKNLKAA